MYTNDSSNEKEKAFLIRLQEGDGLALDYFYRQYSPKIYQKVLKMVKVEVIAEELLQDVFVKLWDKRHLINPDQSFRSYLYTIAQNLVVDFYRKLARQEKLQRQVKAMSSASYLHIEENIFLEETYEILTKAIDCLPSRQKLIFTLCKLEGKSYEEVSATLGISTSTINGHIVKATKTVKSSLFKSQDTNVALLASLMLTSW